MMPALLTSFGAILLIGLATPRQADQWLGRGWSGERRRMLRYAGFAVLALSFLLLPRMDLPRAITGWIGALAVEGVAAALMLRKRRR
ncbi:DUF3325 family protein [Sphingomonas sp. CL5.1]|uniref:DUF3325 family protein n=1 Tax=Sphingomonas sp. CL5.1 TaxID=2653203 RepID=UPI001C2EC1DA|nr:DUF3325 family protein [Sphingomonas sp. CL5.1]